MIAVAVIHHALVVDLHRPEAMSDRLSSSPPTTRRRRRRSVTAAISTAEASAVAGVGATPRAEPCSQADRHPTAAASGRWVIRPHRSQSLGPIWLHRRLIHLPAVPTCAAMARSY